MLAWPRQSLNVKEFEFGQNNLTFPKPFNKSDFKVMEKVNELLDG
ncbi:MAG TPA: hypothetical protein VIJ93_10395 [bacterium]